MFSSRPQPRQRLHSDESITLPLKICACFAPPRAWIYAHRDSTNKAAKRAVDSLFIMACHGNMIQYDLDPKPAAGKRIRVYKIRKIQYYKNILHILNLKNYRCTKGKSM